jgi:hypothetical protein
MPSRRLLPSTWLALGVLALLATSGETFAQRNPRIGYAFPAGARRGSAVSLRLAGQYLEGVSGVVVSGGDVTASVVKYERPMNGKELNLARDRAQALQQALNAARRDSLQVSVRSESDTNHVETLERAAVQKELATLRQRLANPKNRLRENLQLSEDVILALRVAEDALPGRRELRLLTPNGLSNPVVFLIDEVTHSTESEPNNKPAEATLVSALPVIINGQILAGDVDRFRLRLRRGMKLVASVSARDLIPYLADAVPGWFQPTLTLLDAEGHELAYQDDHQFRPDPVICFEVTRDGEYTLMIKDALYRGREDFVYRITVGEYPFLTSEFPLGTAAEAETVVELTGWNLPERQLRVKPPAAATGIIPISVAASNGLGNSLPFALGSLPESSEIEPKSRQKNPQVITVPVWLNGRINPARDEDRFRFLGRAGESIVAEVNARRLGSPLDSKLTLRDAAGKVLATNDDFEDRARGLDTHHADSYLRVTLPTDGEYTVTVADTQAGGGPAFAYRLRVSAPKPDFELRATPSSLNLRPGGSAALTVYILRKDGFTNDVQLALTDAPPGFRLSSAKITGTNDQVKVTLTALGRAASEPVRLHLVGNALVAGQIVTRPAVPAEDMMQAFIYRHLVPVQELLVCVSGRAPNRFGGNLPPPQSPRPVTQPKPN